MGGFRKLKRERHQGDNKSVKEAAGNSSENNVAREEDSFQVDLRLRGGSQDVLCKGEERMVKAQTLVDKLHDGYRTKSIVNDLGRERSIQYFQRSIETHNQGVGQH